MNDPTENVPEPTAVDDVRRVREKIARQHGGDLAAHVRETNRIAEELRSKLNLKKVPSPEKVKTNRVG